MRQVDNHQNTEPAQNQVKPLEVSSHVPEEQLVIQSMLFHCTSSIEEVIDSGILATQSALKVVNPHHYQNLVQASTQDLKESVEKWAPMMSEDQNILYFSSDSIEGVYNKNASVLVIPARRLLINHNLYFRVGHRSGLKHPQVMKKQICVSDVVNKAGFFEEKKSMSNLKIPLSEFILIVPQNKYEKIVLLLRQKGYSEEWISRVQSYSGTIKSVAEQFSGLVSNENNTNELELEFERYSTRDEYHNPILKVKKAKT
jgi:hypothetical protein